MAIPQNCILYLPKNLNYLLELFLGILTICSTVIKTFNLETHLNKSTVEMFIVIKFIEK